MHWLRHAGVLLVACSPVPTSALITAPPATTTPCVGTTLEPLAPDPLGWVDHLVWLDSTTLVAFVGGGPNLQANGLLVLDVPARTIRRAFRGLGPIGNAAFRVGSRGELLFSDQLYRDTRWEHRVGTLDLATGCVRASRDIGTWNVAIDPANDGFVVAADSTPDGGSTALVRYDAATLTPSPKRSVPRFDALSYDPTSNRLVASSYGDDPIRTRDPITLDEREAKSLAVSVRTGFSLRPAHAEIAMGYTKCTPTGRPTRRPSMRVACREGTQEVGWVTVGLDPLVEVRRVERPVDAWNCDDRRISWTPDGARAFIPCHGVSQWMEWTPDTGAFRLIPAPPLDYWARTAWAPDGDTFAGFGAGDTIDVRSISTGNLLWQIPLRKSP